MATIRSQIFNLISKVFNSSKDNSAAASAFKSILVSDLQQDQFILKISEKSIKDIFNVNSASSVLNVREDPLVQKIDSVEPSGDKYYNFNLNKDYFIRVVLNGISALPKTYNIRRNETVIVEYSSPNIAKPFHMGHLRSTVIGQFVANILAESRPVIRMNYLGDWGTQFGLVQAGLENLSLTVDDLKENPLGIINDSYILANKDDRLKNRAKEITSNLEKHFESGELDIWKKLKKLTVKHLEETYRMLGIQFDEYTWESQFATGFTPILEEMKSKRLIEETNGQLVVPRGHKKFPLMKSDGTSLYLSRDILAALDRYKRHKCKSIKYVIDKSQEDHVDTVRYVVSQLTGNDLIDHVKFGKIIGMSTRKGTSIFLSDILDKATELMAQQQQKSPNTRDNSLDVTRSLAISTLVIYLLKQRRTKDFTFDWDTVLQGKGDSGVKLQYTHSRLYSLEQNCGVNLPSECHPEVFTELEALKLIALLERHEQVMINSETNLESSYLVKYLFQLCNATSLCLKVLPVKGESIDLAQQRLFLFHKTRLVLKSTMSVLGLTPLNRI